MHHIESFFLDYLKMSSITDRMFCQSALDMRVQNLKFTSKFHQNERPQTCVSAEVYSIRKVSFLRLLLT